MYVHVPCLRAWSDYEAAQHVSLVSCSAAQTAPCKVTEAHRQQCLDLFLKSIHFGKAYNAAAFSAMVRSVRLFRVK